MPITAFVFNKKNINLAERGGFDPLAVDTPYPVGFIGSSGQRKRFRIKEGAILPKSASITILEPRHGIFKGEILIKCIKRNLGTKERKRSSS